MLCTEMIDEASSVSRTYLVTMPSDEFQRTVDESLSEIQKNTVVSGFRRGRAPLALIRNTDGYTKMMQDILYKHVQQSIPQIVSQNSLNTIGDPCVSLLQCAENQELKYSVTFDVFPALPEIAIETMGLTPYIVQLTETEVEKFLEDLKEYDLLEVSDENYSAVKGDVLILDYVGKVNNKVFKGGVGSNVELALGSSTAIPHIEDELIGARAGMERRLETRFPSDYMNRALAGKPVVFQVKVKKVMRKSLITDKQKLAAKLGCKDEGDLRNKCRDMLQKKYDALAFETSKYEIFANLKKHEFDVPRSLLEKELHNLKSAKVMKEGEELLNEAKIRVRLALLLMNLREKLSLSITKEEIYTHIRPQLAGQEQQEETLFNYFADLYRRDRQVFARVEGELLESKVCKQILDHFENKRITLSAQELSNLLDKVQNMY